MELLNVMLNVPVPNYTIGRNHASLFQRFYTIGRNHASLFQRFFSGFLFFPFTVPARVASRGNLSSAAHPLVRKLSLFWTFARRRKQELSLT